MPCFVVCEPGRAPRGADPVALLASSNGKGVLVDIDRPRGSKGPDVNLSENGMSRGLAVYALPGDPPAGMQAHLSLEAPPGLCFTPLPLIAPTDRYVYYVAAPAGAGKSVWLSNLARVYGYMNPDAGVYLISEKEDDAAFDVLEPGPGGGRPDRLKLRKLVADHPSGPDEVWADFVGSLTILDDLDVVDDRDLYPWVRSLRLKLLSLGRDPLGHGEGPITPAIVSHKPTDYSRTRPMVLESTHYVLWPGKTTARALERLLDQVEMGEAARVATGWTRSAADPRHYWVMFAVQRYPHHMVSADRVAFTPEVVAHATAAAPIPRAPPATDAIIPRRRAPKRRRESGSGRSEAGDPEEVPEDMDPAEVRRVLMAALMSSLSGR